MIDVEYADRVQREEIHFQSLRREIVAIFKLKNPKTCDKISSESEKKLRFHDDFESDCCGSTQRVKSRWTSLGRYEQSNYGCA